MSEMVERVARAMFKRCNPSRDPDKILEGNIRPDWMAFEDLARCAIEAMKVPSEAMVKSAFNLGHEAQCAPEVWQAMIEEALK